MVILIVRRVGNSLGLILPKGIVAEKRLQPNDEVDVQVERAVTFDEIFGCLQDSKLSVKELNDLSNEGEDL